MTVSPDRNCDITRLRVNGMNLSYMRPCGYVAPAYYDSIGSNWLSSFTAGFLTTCGLQAVGSPCEDEGEVAAAARLDREHSALRAITRRCREDHPSLR